MIPKFSIITVSWGHARFMPALFASLDRMTYPKDQVKIWLLDNQSPDDTFAVVRGMLDESGTKTKGGFPCALIKSPTNRGFAGGNNDCMAQALAEGYDWLFLLNPDTEIAPDTLTKLAAAAGDATVGCLQPLMILHPDTDRVNSVGNAIHYLGMSYCDGYRLKRDDPRLAPFLKPRDLVSVSGAAMVLSAPAVREVGMLDEALFAYHEDVELSWRLRLAGWKLRFVPDAVIWHKYEFSRSISKYYWMERNRFLVMLMCYRAATLVLIAPMLLALELGMLPFGIMRGWGREKFRVYGYFLHAKHWRELFVARGRNQKLRKTSDRAVTAGFATIVDYQEISNPILTWIGNPLMTLYWRICRLLLWW
ncbi:glycosyltransferase family 2 protein [Patescibacteria group bacterium]|nr:MAG: glycosyltransferase family 2 protein [Patescibacteria group bacterium]